MTNREFKKLNIRRLTLAEKKCVSKLTISEAKEFAELQKLCFDHLDNKFPRDESSEAQLRKIEKRLHST